MPPVPTWISRMLPDHPVARRLSAQSILFALGDGIFTTGKWLQDPANQATAVKFLKASFQGWIYCRDHAASCVDDTLAYGPTLPKGHQTWMMNEINKLIWPSAAAGIGVMDRASYARTAAISKQFGVIKAAPSAGAYVPTYAAKAVAQLKAAGVDVTGKSWKPAKVLVVGGGK